MPRMLLVVVVVALVGVAAHGAARFDRRVLVDEPMADDLYAAGRTVEIRAAVDGDAVAAGEAVIVSAAVGGDLMAVGERVLVRAAVGDDARLAGRIVDVEARIADHLVAAGQEVTLGPGARVGDWAWLAGETVVLDGEVTGNLRVVARRILVFGRVGGSAELEAQAIEVGAAARIGGDLILRSSSEPKVAAGAEIGGELLRRPTEIPEPDAGPAAEAGAGVLTAAVAVSAVVLYLLFPGVAARGADSIRRRPWSAAGLGLGALAATPLVVALLVISVVGALLGLVLLALYLCALVFALALGLFFLGHRGLALMRREPGGRLAHVLALLAAALVLILLQQVPVVGGLLTFAVLLLGLGGLQMVGWRAYRGGA